MSKFAIYKSQGIALDKLGLIDKLLYSLFAFLLPFFGFTNSLLRVSDITVIILLIVWIFSIAGLIYFRRYLINNLEQIGDINISLSGISKSIAGFDTWFEYDDISDINIKKHFRNFLSFKSADDTKIYFVTILNRNNQKERFIVSGRSTDHPSVNFYQTIKNLDKYKKLKFKLTKG